MNRDYFSRYFSLFSPFRFGIFETIYAAQDGEEADVPGEPCQQPPAPAPAPAERERERDLPGFPTEFAQDKYGGGDAPLRRGRAGKKADGPKSGTSDRGYSGAGVAGSRSTGLAPGPTGSMLHLVGSEDLPPGARNPGLLRYIHNAARYRLPHCFEGACFNVKKCAQNNWVLGHSMTFSSVSPGGYKLLLSYADADKPAAPPYFVMQAAPGGQLSCEVRVGPTRGSRAAIVAQIANGELYSFESILDIYFRNATASVIAVNREFIAVHFLQAISQKLSVGGEIVARGHVSEMSSASAAARWSNKSEALSMTLGNRGVDLCYAKSIKPFLTVAAMIEVGFSVRRALGTLAYEWRSTDWMVRASVDSDGLVGATLQRALIGKNANFSCAVSALLNHPNDKFRLGCGVTANII